MKLLLAADDKIALSMVRVNNKPQHIVLCCNSGHPPTKHPLFACGKSQRGLFQAAFWLPNCPKPAEIARSAAHPSPILSLFPPCRAHKAQNWCIFCGFAVQMWTLGADLVDANRGFVWLSAQRLIWPGASR